MSKANKIEWSNIDSALPRPKRLHLQKDDGNSLYQQTVLPDPTVTDIKANEKPRVGLKLALNSSKVQTKSSVASSTDDDLSSMRSKPGSRLMPFFSPSDEISE